MSNYGHNQEEYTPNPDVNGHNADDDASDEQVRQFLHRDSLEGGETIEDDTAAAIASIIDPTIFDSSEGSSDQSKSAGRDRGSSLLSHLDEGNFDETSPQQQQQHFRSQSEGQLPQYHQQPQQQQQQQQQQQPQQQFVRPTQSQASPYRPIAGTHFSQFSSIRPPSSTSLSHLTAQQQHHHQQRMAQLHWQGINAAQPAMADPFAALMSASTAVANAMDGDAMGDGGARGGQNAVMMGDAMATAAAIAAGEYVKSVGGGGQQAQSSSSTNHDETLCVRCSYPGSDARILCPKRCAYHARCIDLISIVNSQQPSSNNPASRPPQDNSSIAVHSCPHCRSPADGLEILPLSFEGMDRAQRMNQGRLHDATLGGGSNHARIDSEDSNFARKRSNTEMDEGKVNTNSGIPGMLLSATPPVSSYSQSSSQCYDPTVPRTGRWTDEELAFRDSLISHFLEGSLPLSNGLKLNDFLSNILKSKQSRLTKKMKHAKLSTKYFHIKRGFLFDNMAAREFSRLEYSFIHVITDPIERSEIQFHMQREWREHLAERCSYLRIMFDGSAWVKSVEKCDHRVALEKNRTRTVKRRWMMGKAMERDINEKVHGVFIDRGLEKEDLIDGLENDQDGDFGRFLMSILDDGGTVGKSFEHSASSSSSNVAPSMKKASYRSTIDSNFRCAAPFLAGVVSYVEKNAIPFEHVDLWVPSFIPPSDSEQISMGSMGSGSNLAAFAGGAGDSRGVCRLCFAGSATMGLQVLPDDATNISSSTVPTDSDRKENVKTIPLSSDEIFNFSLYGDYSEKFSFSSGCGLPGRVFQSGVAAWEQFVTNAPSHLFERRGGAIQFGIKTALGLPIESPNVGRIVLVLYSKHNREKDEDLVKQIVKDMRLFTPCPRWKLVVDVNSLWRDESSKQLVRPSNAQIAKLSVRSPVGETTEAFNRQNNVNHQRVNEENSPMRDVPSGNAATASIQGTTQNETDSEAQIKNLISLLGENMPSDSTSPLGKQLHDLMSLRLVLLRRNRTPEEQALVDTILILFDSYLTAGRSRQDIALLVCRDFMFHTEQNQRASLLQQQQQQQRSLAGQQQLQSLSQNSNLGMMQSSIFQTLGLSQSLPSTHSHLGGQQVGLLHSNTYPQLALDHQQQHLMQQFNFPPSYLTNRPNSGQDDESLGTHSAGGPSRR